MKTILRTIPLLFVGLSEAVAHPGHFPVKDGHDHIVALAAFGAALVIAAVAGYRAYRAGK